MTATCVAGCGGVVLCGGNSRRMGRPKAWLPFAGEHMLPRVVRIIGSVAAPIVVVAAPGQSIPPLPDGTEIVRDECPGRGPLEGMAAGLRAIAARGIDCAFISSCDVPLLRAAFVRDLIDRLGGWDIAVPFAASRHHPLAAVYRTRVLATINELLSRDRRRPIFLFESCPTRLVTEDELRTVDPNLDSLRNLNTPDDYAEACRLSGTATP